MASDLPPPPAATDDRGEAVADLTGAVVSGSFWKAATHAVGEGTRVIVAVVLAHLLTPSDYGVAGMALVVAGFVTILTDPALGSALIQRQVITERDRSTVFWTATGIGVVLSIGGVLSAGLVADAFGERDVKPLFQLMSLTFVLVALSVAPRALLARKLAFRSLELRDMAATVIGAGTALVAALAGAGPWAIVANSFTYAVVSTTLIWVISDWRPQRVFSLASVRSLRGFSIRVFMAQIIGWCNSNMDNVLVGRFLGAAALGTYSLAYNLMYMPMVRIARPLAQVLSPAYSRLQSDRARLESAWLRTRRVTFTLVAPCFAVIVVIAPDLVSFAFGDKWRAAVTPLRLLCVAGLADAIGVLNWAVLQAVGKAAALLRITILTTAVTVASFAIGLPWGIDGVATSYAAASWLLLVPETLMTTRAISFRFWPAFWAGFGIVPVVALASLAGLGVRELLVDADAPVLVRLAAASLTLFLVYGVSLRLAFPKLVAEIWYEVRRRRPSLRRPNRRDPAQPDPAEPGPQGATEAVP